MINNKKKVKTFNGEEAIRLNCRYISGKFYEMGKQCFKMSDGKWHRINNGLIDFDNEINHWVLKSGVNLYNGIISFDGDSPVYGKFTQNNIKNIEIVINNNNESVLGISENILPKDYVEILGNGKFIKKSLLLKGKKYLSKYIGARYPFRLNYSFEHEYPVFKKYYDNNFVFNRDITKKFYKELGETTFGVEFETYNGQIPVRHCYKSGLIPLKDGSLRHGDVTPFEYTTIPFKGEKGLHAIKQSCELLNKYCERNIDGSLHIHVGNFKRTPEYGIAIFRLLYQLQNEIYEMFPRYFRQTSKFKATGKDYCKALPNVKFDNNLDKDLKKLFNYYVYGETTVNHMYPVAEDDDEDEDENVPDLIRRMRAKQRESKKFSMGMPHPSDAGFDHKWNVNYRYFWCNLIPLFFNNRGTVEFRVHTASFNSDKVINWLFIVNSICKYADKYQKEISKNGVKINLNSVLTDVYSDELSSYLKSYSSFRKEMMTDHANKGDFIGAYEVEDDSLEKWSYPIKSLI